MAAATLAGSIVPAIPFVTGYGRSQVIACGCLTICGALVIGRYRGYRIRLGILAIVGSLTIGLSLPLWPDRSQYHPARLEQAAQVGAQRRNQRKANPRVTPTLRIHAWFAGVRG